MIFLTVERWDVIREQFSEDEKDRINAAIDGETICPRGGTLDEAKLGAELTLKLTAAIEGKSVRDAEKRTAAASQERPAKRRP